MAKKSKTAVKEKKQEEPKQDTSLDTLYEAVKLSLEVSECDLTAAVRQFKEIIVLAGVLENRFSFRLEIGGKVYEVGVERVNGKTK